MGVLDRFSKFFKNNNENNINNKDIERRVTQDLKETQDVIFATNNGVSKAFVDRNKRTIDESRNLMANVLSGYGVGERASNNNSIKQLAETVNSTRRNNYEREDPKENEEDMGFKMISPLGNMVSRESEIIAEGASQYASFYSVTAEYKGVVDCIPQLGRAIRNIRRDTLNTSEVSKKAFNDIYEDDSVDKKGKERTARIVNSIYKEVIEKNNLEKKVKEWMYESMVSGVKPIACIPYKYILTQVKNSNLSRKLGLNISDVNKKIRSGESFIDGDKQSKLDKIMYEVSLKEAFSKDRSSENIHSSLSDNDYFNEKMNSIVDEELIEDYIISYESILADTINKLNNAIKSGESSQEDVEFLNSTNKSFINMQNNIKNKSKEEKIKSAKEGLMKLAKAIDNNIQVVKPEYTGIKIANKIHREKNRYKKFYDLGSNYKMAEKVLDPVYPYENGDKITVNNEKRLDDVLDKSLEKECLIVPYQSESVIPIQVNGEYMGFYCLEYEHTLGSQFTNKRKYGSFTDFIKAQGLGGDDKALMTGGAGMPTNLAAGSLDNLGDSLYSPMALYNMAASTYFSVGDTNGAEQRYETLKKITLRVLAHRLHDPDLVDNKCFKDAVVHLLRNDVLSANKIQFTFIPPEFMVYMTYQVDDEGIPKSILDGSLFYCYLYISSVISSAMIKLMKSGDKEKYTVDVGLMKNIGASVNALQRNLSTRPVYSSATFSSLNNVLRNSSNYYRLIVPSIKDKLLYDVEQLSTYNDIDPDDEFTKQLLQAILDNLYINAGSMQSFEDPDFAKQISARNLEYMYNIIECQSNYEKHLTKLLKILTKYSSLKTYNSKDTPLGTGADILKEDDKGNVIDLDKIKLKLSLPNYISMINAKDEIDTAKDLAETIASVFGLEGGNSLTDKARVLFVKRIVSDQVRNLNLEDYEDIYQECIVESQKEVISDKKISKIDEKINSEDMGSSGGMDDLSGGNEFGGSLESEEGNDFGGGDEFESGDIGMDEGEDMSSF